jgi:hypothetical protein
MACGAPIGEVGTVNAAPSAQQQFVNRLRIVETPKSRSLEAEFSNEVAVPFADALGVFAAGQLAPRQGVRRTVEKNSTGARGDGQIALPEPEAEAEEAITVEAKVTDVSISLSEYGGMDKLMAEIDRSAHPEIFNASGLRDQSLHLLSIVRRRFGIDGLTAVDIEKLLKEKFRLPATTQGVHSAFDRFGHLVDRVPSDKGSYRYRLMDAGEKYLAAPESHHGAGGAHRGARRRSHRSKPVASAPKNGTAGEMPKQASSTEKKSKAHAGRPGPMASIRMLVEKGYFSVGRTLAEIRAYLEEEHAIAYENGDLTPTLTRSIRNTTLKREKREGDGQYEYRTP